MCFRGLRFIDDATENLIDDAKEKTQVMDHSLNNVFAFSTTQKQITTFNKEGLLHWEKNGAVDRRTKIDFEKAKFRLYSYTTLCQMKVQIRPGFEAVGSCSRLMLHGRHYIFTCAHNLVSWNTLEDRGENVEAGFVYTMRQGEHKWAFLKKILVKEILVHPNYNGEPYSGFDIGVAPIMHQHHKLSKGCNFTRKNDVAWGPTEPESIEEGLKIEVAGFPGEKKGCSYVHCGKIVAKKKTKKGGWLIFYDVDTTLGNSGSDINVIDKTWVQSWHQKRGRSSSKSKLCIGVHNGHCDASRLNYGTLITPAIERWFNVKTKEKKVVVVN